MKKIITTLILTLFLCVSHAKTYKVFIGTSPGSASDIQTRKLFDEVSKETGDTFVILNKPGAAFLVAYKAFMEESKTNQNVILFNVISSLITAYITNPNGEIDPNNELKGLMPLQKVHYFVVVRSNSNYKTASDLVGKINIASTSVLSELLIKKYLAHASYQIVPYKSENDSMFALLKNEIDVASSHNINTALLANKDKLRVIKVYPENMIGAVGYSVPKDFPEDEKRKLSLVMNKVVKSTEFSSWMKETTGFEPEGGSGEKYDEILRNSFNEIIKLKDK